MCAQTDGDRPYDLILYGATGFTGQLVARYLLDHPQADSLSWAIAGRDRAKLDALRRQWGRDALPLVLADSTDTDSLRQMAAQTTALCTTVGPYARYGSDLVAACIDEGTDYCDLTGEVHWVRQMIERHHRRAVDNQVRILHCCGFDSIPSDLGVYFLQSQAREHLGEPVDRIRMLLWGAKGGISGGTAASMADLVEAASRDASIRRILSDPYSLAPSGHRGGPDTGVQQWSKHEEDLDVWTAPFIMAAINEKIVRRTNALLDYPYGESFRYREATRVGSGVPGIFRANLMSAAVAALSAGLALGPTRALLKRFLLPESGEGPDQETIESGHFTLRFFGTRASSSNDTPLVVEVSADADPGYGATSMMLGETALALALDDPDDFSDPHLHDGGVLTPAAALGDGLIDRLQEAGLRFQTLESPS